MIRLTCYFSLPLKLLQLLTLIAVIVQNGRAQETSPLLMSESSLERELKGGETHVFQLHLNSGQFLHVAIEQKGINVTIMLLGPDGQQLAFIDGPNSLYGPKPIVAIAAIEGTYSLKISSLDKKGSIGRYGVKVLALREATPTDHQHVIAERAFEEARKLRLQRTATAWRTAIEKYQQALQFFQGSDDQYRCGLTLYSIGLCHANLGDFHKALEFATQSLTLFQAAKDHNQEASALNLMGGANDTLGELIVALTYYKQALTLTQSVRNKNTEASILNNIGKIYYELADWQQTLEYNNQALSLNRELGDRQKEGGGQHNIGMAYLLLGEFEKALDHFRQALQLRQAIGDKNGEAETLNSTGNVYSELGENQKALELYNQALQIRRIVGDKRGEGVTLNVIGVVYAMLGEREKALDCLQQARQLSQAVGDRRLEAQALDNIGRTFTLLRQPIKALEYHNQALVTFQTIGDQQNEAKSLQSIARAERDRGNLDVARQQIESALTLYEKVRTKVGAQQSRASYFSVQQTAYQFYTDLLMQMHKQNPSAGHDIAALQISERARARSLLEILAESKVDFREGVDAKLLVREHDLMQQINAKATRLMQRNTADKIVALKKELSELEDEYQQTQNAIRKSNSQYANVTQPQPLRVPAIQKELDENTLLLEYALGEERSFVWAVTNNSVTSYELPKQEEIKIVANQVYEALTARTLVINLETPPAKRERIMQADAQFSEASVKLSEMILAPLAGQLGNKRLVIVADGALQYVPFAALPSPDGEGFRVSGFESREQSNNVTSRTAKPETQNAKPLIVAHEIITLPSASTIAVLRKELVGRPIAPKMLAVIADPVFSNEDERAKISKVKLARTATVTTEARSIVHTEEKPADSQKMTGGMKIPRLPYTHQEADQIFAVAPKATSFKATDFKASRATAFSPDLKQYRFIHFATHGFLDSERPGLSALALSMVDEQGNPQEGFLRAHELYNFKLPAELVVLSACQTGLGKEVKGEGLMGLTRGFMYAGAARVIVSLWSVNDKATAELMTKLYQNMLQKGERPAAALRIAQVAMWQQKQWQAPYYWAAFVLQGEWK